MVGDISATLLRCIGEHQRSLAMHPRGISGNGGGGGGGGDGRRERERGGGGVDLYKFLSWFMFVIFLY